MGACFFLPCPSWPGCSPGFLSLLSLLLRIFFACGSGRMAGRNSHSPGSAEHAVSASCPAPLPKRLLSGTAAGAGPYFSPRLRPSDALPGETVLPAFSVLQVARRPSLRIPFPDHQRSQTTAPGWLPFHCERGKAPPAFGDSAFIVSAVLLMQSGHLDIFFSASE